MTVGAAGTARARHDAWPRKMMLAAALVAALLLAMLVPVAPAGASDNDHGGGKITFCHATSSAQNPYVVITTDPASIVKRGHTSEAHQGPIFESGMVSGLDQWGDVIPPFQYSSTATSTGSFAGTSNVDWTRHTAAELPGLCLGDGGGGGGDEVPVGEVTVVKTADTSLTRTHGWSIDKSVAPNPLKLYIGDTNKTATWDVDVTYLGSTDSAWAVAGTITTTNVGNVPVRIDTVEDGIEGSTVDCGVDVLPATLEPAQSLTCDYTAALASADSGTNTATAAGEYLFAEAPDGVASSDNAPLETTGSAEYDFADPVVTQVNDTVTVTDNHAGFGLAYNAAQTTLDAADFQDPAVSRVTNFEYTDSFDRADYPMRGSTCVGESILNTAKVMNGPVELDAAQATLAVQVQCLVIGSGETAVGRGYRWSSVTGGTSNWFMFTPWATAGSHRGLEAIVDPSNVDIVAGQHHVIGNVSGTRNGATALQFNLIDGWELKNVTGNVKVHPMSCTPPKYIQPGGFSVKRNVSPTDSPSFTVSGTGMTNTACYGIHLDVVRIIPDPNF